LKISSHTNQRSVTIPLHELQPRADEAWANYPIGVIKVLPDAGFELSTNVFC